MLQVTLFCKGSPESKNNSVVVLVAIRSERAYEKSWSCGTILLGSPYIAVINPFHIKTRVSQVGKSKQKVPPPFATGEKGKQRQNPVCNFGAKIQKEKKGC